MTGSACDTAVAFDEDDDLNSPSSNPRSSGLYRSVTIPSESEPRRATVAPANHENESTSKPGAISLTHVSGLLSAAMTFLDGVAMNRFSRDDLRVWIERHLVHTGLMTRPWRIQEPLIGVLPTDRQCGTFLPEMPPEDETAAILVRARARVIGTLHGLLMTPTDDRFLSAAIFAGRVRRVVVGKNMLWVPRPRPHDALSDIVLSLFIADILRRREYYASNLCICDTCGRVRFDDEPRMRHGCYDHLPELPPRVSSRRRIPTPMPIV